MASDRATPGQEAHDPGPTEDGQDVAHFGSFTFRRSTRELLRDGRPVALPPKASLVLAELLRTPGRLVVRSDLHRAAWGSTVVEFDQGLNRCIRQIRRALGDDARDPTFVETVPRRGYRFRHPVSGGEPGHASLLVARSSATASTAGRPASRAGPTSAARRRRWSAAARGAAAAAAVGVALTVAFSVGRFGAPGPAHPGGTVFLADFQATPSAGPVAVAEQTAVPEALESAVRHHLAVLARATPADSDPSPEPVRFVLTGTLVPAPDGVLLHAALIRTADGEAVWSGSYNPFCEEVRGDPVRVIGALVARSVAERVGGTT